MDPSKGGALEELVGLLSLAVLFVGSIAFSGIGIANYVLPSLGMDMDAKMQGWGVVWFLLIASAVLVVVAYLSFIVWLLLGRTFLSANSVWRVVRMGPSTRLDRWLVREIVGESDRVQN